MSDAGSLLWALAVLAGVLGAVLMLGVAFRRLGPRLGLPAADLREIELVASRPLDARSRALLLRCRGRDYFVVLSAAGATLLDSFAASGGGDARAR